MNSEPIPRRPAGMSEVPLSALQQRLYFLCTNYHGTSSPVVYLAFRLRGPVDLDALTAALRDVSDRQESMRTRILRRTDGPVAVIDPPGTLQVHRLDLTRLPPTDRETRMRALLDQWALTLFDLDGDPLVHARILTLDPDHHVLSVVLHHIIADGASTAVLAREIGAHYHARTTNTPPAVPHLPIGYGDFALWQSHGNGLGGPDGLQYWTRQLTGLPVPDLHTDRPRPAHKGTRGADLRHPLGTELTLDLEKLARDHRCSLFHVLLATFWALLSRHGAGPDICVGSPIGARTRTEFEPLIGNFGNTLPLRGDLTGNPTFTQLLNRARTTTLAALAHQDVPFAHVIAALNPPPDQSRMQVFGAILVLHYTAIDNPLPGLPAQPIPAVGAPQITHDIVLDGWRDHTQLTLMLRYDTALFNEPTMRQWATEYEAMLRAAIADPDTRLSGLGRPAALTGPEANR